MSEKASKTWQDYGREWLDTLVVAISVAMAFRAYFFEPFNIPTGSMQPTLYGNHSEPCPDPGVVQTSPLKWLEWIFSGREYKEIVAPVTGNLHLTPRNDGRIDLRVVSPSGAGADKAFRVPTDVVPIAGGGLIPRHQLKLGDDYSGKQLCLNERGYVCEVARGAHGEVYAKPVLVRQGQRIWSGYDVTGDFIFVNRWKWNFRQPARGDVMVFATTGIKGLQQGTHYIKRLTALPGETVEIRKPDVYINGAKVDPIKPMTGARGEPTPLPNPGGENGMKGPVSLGEGEYFACGDNSDNSLDSRYWGPVPESNLKGTGSLVFWPIINSRWGVIK